MCHITKSGGSHLEMQSRSIDSYVHAIHSGQAFDVADIDFKDPVQALKYEHHISMPYPTHAIDELRVLPREGHVQRAGPVRVAAGPALGLGQERDLGPEDRHCAVRRDRSRRSGPVAAATGPR